jgi:hypothetical protein
MSTSKQDRRGNWPRLVTRTRNYPCGERHPSLQEWRTRGELIELLQSQGLSLKRAALAADNCLRALVASGFVQHLADGSYEPPADTDAFRKPSLLPLTALLELVQELQEGFEESQK